MGSDIRGIIFDLDGVIADSHPIHEKAWRALLRERRSNVSDAELAAVIREGKTRAEILRTLLPDGNAAALGQRKDQLYYEYARQLQPVAGVVEWIEELCRLAIPLAVATSASRSRALDTLARFGIEKSFQAVITSTEIPAGKPDPALFLAAAAALRTQPVETLVVEDSSAGVEAAYAAGMPCVCYSREGCSAAQLTITDFSVNSLAPIMRQIGGKAA